MALSFSFSMATTLMLVLLIISISLHSTDADVGVCYGRKGSNLPPAKDVIALFKQNNIKKMRLYEPDPPTLAALGNSGIELMLGVLDEDLPALANNSDAWVRRNILSYPAVNFRYIVIGNEVDVFHPLSKFVLPAMWSVRKALLAAGIKCSRIAVSTSISTDLLEKSFPPSAGKFKGGRETEFIKPIIEFLMERRAPLLVSVYPYFAYKNNPVNITRSFALLEQNSGMEFDGVKYDNLFYAMIDAVYAAMEKVLYPYGLPSPSSFRESKALTASLSASESGFPSKSRTPPKPPSGAEALGDGSYEDGEVGEWSCLRNAMTYNNNLMRVVKGGTPMRPGTPIETYIFAMFDEDLKTGEEEEKNFGIFSPLTSQKKYQLTFY